MQLAIDKFGRIVLPKAIRDGLNPGPGSVLSIETEGDDIRVEAVATVIKLDRGDYQAILDDMSAVALSGGVVYDALAARAAALPGP